MSERSNTADDFLAISPRIRVMPIIHGSGDFAIQVREELLSRPYDCLAVPLPPSFQDEVEAAVEQLPAISVVVQVDAETGDDETETEMGFSYVPIDPCQGVIAGLRTATRRADCARVHRSGNAAVRAGRRSFPDPYALKRVSPERFAAALLAAVPPPRPASIPDASPGWRPGFATWNHAIARSSSSARSSTGPGSAMPTSGDWNRRGPSRSSRRSQPTRSIPRP